MKSIVISIILLFAAAVATTADATEKEEQNISFPIIKNQFPAERDNSVSKPIIVWSQIDSKEEIKAPSVVKPIYYLRQIEK